MQSNGRVSHQRVDRLLDELRIEDAPGRPEAIPVDSLGPTDEPLGVGGELLVHRIGTLRRDGVEDVAIRHDPNGQDDVSGEVV